MITVLEIPSVVKSHESLFGFSGQIKKHFSQYLTGLIVSENLTVTGINSIFKDANDQSSMNRFLTEYEWDEQEVNDKRLGLLQSAVGTKWIKSGFVVIDDTLVDKDGIHIAGVGKLFDHCEGKYVLAQNVVTSHYVDTRVGYPIDLRQYFKADSEEAKEHGFKTKIELACELIDDAEKRKVAATLYLFDAWFLCKDVTGKVEGYGKSWVSRCKSDRLVASDKMIPLNDFAKSLSREQFREIKVNNKKYLVYEKCVRLNKIGRVKLVVSFQWDEEDKKYQEEPAFIATNRLEWRAERILSSYAMRFSIDAFYRDAKQYLGFEDAQMRNLRGITRHWYLGFLAYSLIKLSVCKSKIGRKMDAMNSVTIGDVCRATSKEVLSSLIMWVYKQFHNNVGPDEIVKVLTCE